MWTKEVWYQCSRLRQRTVWEASANIWGICTAFICPHLWRGLSIFLPPCPAKVFSVTFPSSCPETLDLSRAYIFYWLLWAMFSFFPHPYLWLATPTHSDLFLSLSDVTSHFPKLAQLVIPTILHRSHPGNFSFTNGLKNHVGSQWTLGQNW
jgi:hypothetical protein